MRHNGQWIGYGGGHNDFRQSECDLFIVHGLRAVIGKPTALVDKIVTFPVFINVGPWQLHPHLVFELLGYSVGLLLYIWLRQRRGDSLDGSTRWRIVIAAFIGAALGSRLLSLLEQPALLSYWREQAFWIGGKTIVGGLIGGLIAVEWTKRHLGVRTRTGDLFAIPLAVGIAIGRVGCFVTGLPDGTYGNPTAVWTGVDFGDGVPRHPTQLYEIAFLLSLIPVLKKVGDSGSRAGDQFRVFMVTYLLFRLVVDFLKPDPALVLGLSSIQWTCVAMLAFYARDVRLLAFKELRA